MCARANAVSSRCMSYHVCQVSRRVPHMRARTCHCCDIDINTIDDISLEGVRIRPFSAFLVLSLFFETGNRYGKSLESSRIMAPGFQRVLEGAIRVSTVRDLL